MMKTTEIIEKIGRLPESFLQSASDYIDYLLEKAKTQAQKQDNGSNKRQLGLGRGEAWISPDFDEPLEDMKDYM